MGDPASSFSEDFSDPASTPPVVRPDTIGLATGGRANMGEERWFYRTEHEWIALVERLKLTPCPHCQVVGALNRHGDLRGYDDSSPRRKTVRGRRIFCTCPFPRCGRSFGGFVPNWDPNRRPV